MKYDFKPVDGSSTEFIYSEWEDSGELAEPMPEEAIVKLKELIEEQ